MSKDVLYDIKKKLTYKVGNTIQCPFCSGKGGKIQLLYYWIECHFCKGYRKFKIEEILATNKLGDVKCLVSFTPNQHSNIVLKSKIEWLP